MICSHCRSKDDEYGVVRRHWQTCAMSVQKRIVARCFLPKLLLLPRKPSDRYIVGLMSSINLGKRCIMLAVVGETEHDRLIEAFDDLQGNFPGWPE